MTKLCLHLPYMWGHCHVTYFSFIPAGLRTVYDMTHMKGTHLSFSESSHQCRVAQQTAGYTEATQLRATRLGDTVHS